MDCRALYNAARFISYDSAIYEFPLKQKIEKTGEHHSVRPNEVVLAT